jgi:hypothetical protein
MPRRSRGPNHWFAATATPARAPGPGVAVTVSRVSEPGPPSRPSRCAARRAARARSCVRHPGPAAVIDDDVALHLDRADLVAAHPRAGLLLAAPRCAQPPRPPAPAPAARLQQLERRLAVQVLAAPAVDPDGQSARARAEHHRRRRLVAVLPAGPAAARELLVQFIRGDRHPRRPRPGQHHHRHRARVHPPALLGRRHPLPAVPAGLVREARSTPARRGPGSTRCPAARRAPRGQRRSRTANF